MDILRGSVLYTPTFDKKLARMCDHNFANPNFPAKHLLKDINLFLQQAQADNLNGEAIAGVRTIAEQTIALCLANADYSAIYAAINPEDAG